MRLLLFLMLGLCLRMLTYVDEPARPRPSPHAMTHTPAPISAESSLVAGAGMTPISAEPSLTGEPIDELADLRGAPYPARTVAWLATPRAGRRAFAPTSAFESSCAFRSARSWHSSHFHRIAAT